MHYCDNCHLVCEGPVCPYCGKAHLRAPENSDYCYLATMDSPWGEAMQELLKAMQEYAAQQAAQRTWSSGSSGGTGATSGTTSGGTYSGNASGACTGSIIWPIVPLASSIAGIRYFSARSNAFPVRSAIS